MGSRVRRSLLLAVSAGLAVFASSSCEKHAGDLPEVQKEHIYPVVNEMEPAASAGQTPSAKPTPADFFPDSGR